MPRADRSDNTPTGNTPTDNTTDARQWYRKGRILADAGKHREAVEAFTAALKKDAELGEAYFARSASHYLLGRYPQAAADLDAAALMGCRDAQFWSRYENGIIEDEEDGKSA